MSKERRIGQIELYRLHAFCMMPLLTYVQDNHLSCATRESAGELLALNAVKKKKEVSLLELISGASDEVDDAGTGWCDTLRLYVGVMWSLVYDAEFEKLVRKGITQTQFNVYVEEHELLQDANSQTKLDAIKNAHFPLINVIELCEKYKETQYKIDKLLMLLDTMYGMLHIDTGLVLRIITDNILLRECENFSLICNFKYDQGILELIWEDHTCKLETVEQWHKIYGNNGLVIITKI